MRRSPRLRRLESDWRAMQQLQAESSLIHITTPATPFAGPPEVYVVRFLGRGVWKPESSNAVLLREGHEVLIRLGASYPRMIPELVWRTPIFHPNISSNGVVCLGGYSTHWACPLCGWMNCASCSGTSPVLPITTWTARTIERRPTGLAPNPPFAFPSIRGRCATASPYHRRRLTSDRGRRSWKPVPSRRAISGRSPLPKTSPSCRNWSLSTTRSSTRKSSPISLGRVNDPKCCTSPRGESEARLLARSRDVVQAFFDFSLPLCPIRRCMWMTTTVTRGCG